MIALHTRCLSRESLQCKEIVVGIHLICFMNSESSAANVNVLMKISVVFFFFSRSMSP